jgi:hypothetical protein
VADPTAPLLGVFCHHRCGSTWLSDLLEEVCRYTGHRFARVFDSEMVGGNLSDFVRRQQVEVLAYMNADWQQVEPLGALLGVHVVRDPRDILVSSYYAHRFSHPTDYWTGLADHRQELERLSRGDGLLAEVQCRRMQFQQMLAWSYGAPGMLELRFEDLVGNPADQVARLLEHLALLTDAGHAPGEQRQEEAAGGRLRRLAVSAMEKVRGSGDPARSRGSITRSSLPAILERYSFEALSGGRRPGEEDPMHHYRRGTPGEWREALSTEHVATLEAHFPELLATLGYGS